MTRDNNDNGGLDIDFFDPDDQNLVTASDAVKSPADDSAQVLDIDFGDDPGEEYPETVLHASAQQTQGQGNSSASQAASGSPDALIIEMDEEETDEHAGRQGYDLPDSFCSLHIAGGEYLSRDEWKEKHAMGWGR
jgi:hypothetical protein